MLRRDEVRAAGELAGEALGGAGAIVRDVHRAASGRVFGALGVAAAPVRIAHDGISSLVFSSVRMGLKAVPSGGSRALALSAPADAPRLADTPRGAFALAAINGMWGDRLVAGPLGLGFDLRVDGEPTGKLVVFVHGLCETDDAWALGGGPTYGDRLRGELGFTPVYARYNTGRHISDNGRALAAALDALVEGWPVPVGELVLVGHSMGGLVSRGACHYAERDGLAWAEPLRHVVCLGSPHLGAPLERAAARGSHLLNRLPETAPFARLLTARSAGVKDLRYGSCVEADWEGIDPDEWGPDRCTDVPFLPTAAYYYVGATLARDKDSRLGRIVGDVLVQFPSASGDGPARRLAFELENGLHLGGANHLQLLNHPRVYAQLRRWLTGSRAGAGRPAVPAPAAG